MRVVEETEVLKHETFIPKSVITAGATGPGASSPFVTKLIGVRRRGESWPQRKGGVSGRARMLKKIQTSKVVSPGGINRQ